jgi:hypothetical protein
MALSHVMNLVSNSGLVGAAGGSGSGGGGGSNDSQTVTVGSHAESFPPSGLIPASTTNFKGFFTNIYATEGSISDGTSNLYGGASIVELQYTWSNVFGISRVILSIAGNNRANSGWTTLTIGTTSYSRTNATYSATNGANTTWVWSISPADLTGAQNPFAATGQTTTCVFT